MNPVQGTLIPSKARESEQTYAYDLIQILQILDILPLLPKSAIAMASFAGLREGELKGIEWSDYSGTELTVSRSIWKSVVEPTEDAGQSRRCPCNSCIGFDSGGVPHIHGQSEIRSNFPLR